MSAQRRLVLVAGFTAAGKTTHSRLLADHLGWGYLGSSQLLRKLLPVRCPADREWLPAFDEQRRSGAGIDEALDHQLDLPPVNLNTQVHEKDEFSVATFKRIYDVDFGPDPDLFDVIIDNSRFISEASIAASDRGIAEFEQGFQRVITAHL